MIIESYYMTEDVKALRIFEHIVNVHSEWRKNVLSICSDYGFESFSGPDFCTPDFYHMERFSHALRSRLFTQVEDKSVYAAPDHDIYTLRRDYPAASDIYRKIDLVCQRKLEAIGLTQNEYGRPRHVGYQHAICMLLQIDHVHNKGDVTAFSQIWRVLDEKGKPVLVASIPSILNHETNAYTVHSLASEWNEILPQKVITAFNLHNSIVHEGRPE